MVLINGCCEYNNQFSRKMGTETAFIIGIAETSRTHNESLSFTGHIEGKRNRRIH